MEKNCSGMTEKPVMRLKLRRMSRYSEYFDCPT